MMWRFALICTAVLTPVLSWAQPQQNNAGVQAGGPVDQNTVNIGSVARALADYMADFPNIRNYGALQAGADETADIATAEEAIATNGTLWIRPGALNFTPPALPPSPAINTPKLIHAQGNSLYGTAQFLTGYGYDTVETFFNSKKVIERDNTFHGENSMLDLVENITHTTGATGGTTSALQIDQNSGSPTNILGSTTAPWNDYPWAMQINENDYVVGNANVVGLTVTSKRRAGASSPLWAHDFVVQDETATNSLNNRGLTGLEGDCRARGLDNGGATSLSAYGSFGPATGYLGIPSGSGIRPCINLVLKQTVTTALPLDTVNAAEFGNVSEITWNNSGSTGSTPTVMAKRGYVVAVPIENAAFDATYSYYFPGAAAFAMGSSQPIRFDEDLPGGGRTLYYDPTISGLHYTAINTAGAILSAFSVLDTGEIDVSGAISAPGSVSSVVVNTPGSYSTPPLVTFSAPPSGGTTAVGTAQLGATIGQTVTLNNAGTDGFYVGQILALQGGTYVAGTSLKVDSIVSDGQGNTPDTGAIATLHVNTGGRYSVLPSFPAALSGGTGDASVILAFGVNAVALSNAGRGYTSAPAITFGSGSAVATATVPTTVNIGSPLVGASSGTFGGKVSAPLLQATALASASSLATDSSGNVIAGSAATLVSSGTTTPASGATDAAIPTGFIRYLRAVEPTATIAALTEPLPASPFSGQQVIYYFTQQITALSFSGGTQQVFTGSYASQPVAAGTHITMTYNSTDAAWE